MQNKSDLKATYFPDRRLKDLQWNSSTGGCTTWLAISRIHTT